MPLIWEFAVPKIWFPRLKLVPGFKLIRRSGVRNVLKQMIGPLLWICKKCLLLVFLVINDDDDEEGANPVPG